MSFISVYGVYWSSISVIQVVDGLSSRVVRGAVHNRGLKICTVNRHNPRIPMTDCTDNNILQETKEDGDQGSNNVGPNIVDPNIVDPNTAVQQMDKDRRCYYLHREEYIAKKLQRYHSRPDVIAKKAERERKKAEKEAQKLIEKEEREQRRKEQLEMAQMTRKKKQALPTTSSGLSINV